VLGGSRQSASAGFVTSASRPCRRMEASTKLIRTWIYARDRVVGLRLRRRKHSCTDIALTVFINIAFSFWSIASLHTIRSHPIYILGGNTVGTGGLDVVLGNSGTALVGTQAHAELTLAITASVELATAHPALA
jgi:hypothetical protein